MTSSSSGENNKAWKQAVSGATAGCVSRFVIAPMDVIKIRYQLQVRRTHLTATSPQPVVKYRSIVQSVRCIIREEGWKALWKGNLSAELLYLNYGAAQFLAFHQTQAFLQRQKARGSLPITTTTIEVLSGAVAGTVATSVTYPLDLLRTRFAAQGEPRDATTQIYQQEGLQGFYRGLTPSLVQIAPSMAITFGLFGFLRRLWDQFEVLQPWQSGRDMMCGGLAGIMSKISIMPLDVIRKNQQVQGPQRKNYAVEAIPQYHRSTLRIATQIVHAEGLRGLYKGLVPSILKAGPASAITFMGSYYLDVLLWCPRYYGSLVYEITDGSSLLLLLQLKKDVVMAAPLSSVKECLLSEEVTERWFALKGLYHAPVHQWPKDVLQMTDLGHELIYLTNDELSENRCMASVVAAMWLFAQPAPSKQLTDFIYQRVLKLFISDYFPVTVLHKEDEFYKDRITNMNKMKERIMMMRAMSFFLDFASLNDPTTSAYMDALYFILLGQPVHHFYQIEVFYALHAQLELTPRNRYRIGALIERIEALSTEDQSRPMRHPILHRHTSRFWSVWTPIRQPRQDELVATSKNMAHLRKAASTIDSVQGHHDIVSKHRKSVMISTDFNKALSIGSTKVGGLPRSSSMVAANAQPRRSIVNNLNSSQTFPSPARKMSIFSMTDSKPKGPAMTPTLLSDDLRRKIERNEVKAPRPRLFDWRSMTEVVKPSQNSASNDKRPDFASITLAQPATDVWNTAGFSLNVTNNQVLFNRYPCSKDLILKNDSTNELISFRIQVSPRRHFQVTPSYGVIEKGTSLTVTVRFRPNPYKPLTDPEVHGYLRLRLSDGTSNEKVTLIGYNAPIIKVSATFLDFGYCQLDRDKTVAFTVQNLLNADIPVAISMLFSERIQQYHISEPQFTLGPYEKMLVKVDFSPNKMGKVSDKLAIVSLGHEMLVLDVKSATVPVLDVKESDLDFGKVQIDVDNNDKVFVTRRIHIENLTRDIIPVNVWTASNEIQFIYGTENPQATFIHNIGPNQVLQIIVRFQPKIPGLFESSIVVSSPFMENALVMLKSNVIALNVGTPLEIVMPPARLGESSSSDLPVIFCGSLPDSLEGSVEFDFKSPFSIVSATKADDLRSDEQKQAIYFPMGRTVLLQLLFRPTACGTFRTTLNILTFGMKLTVYVNAICPAINSQKYNEFRRFLAHPSIAPPVSLPPNMALKSEANTVLSVSELIPPVLIGGEFDPTFNINGYSEFVYRKTKLASEPRIATFTLKNPSNEPRNYNIYISGPLEIDIPFEGTLLQLSEIEVNVRLDDRVLVPSYPTQFKANEVSLQDFKRWVNGTITVIDDKGGLLSVPVSGILTEAVAFECANSEDEFVVVPAIAGFGKRDTKIICLRNRSGRNVNWSANIYTYRGPTLPIGDEPNLPNPDLDKEEQQIFSISKTSGVLAPFSLEEMSVQCMTILSGEYYAKIWVDYEDFSENDKGMRRLSSSILLKYSTGITDIQFPKNLLDFGSVEAGVLAAMSIDIKNNSALQAKATASVLSNMFTAPDFSILSPSGITSLRFECRSANAGAPAIAANISVEGILKSFPIVVNLSRTILNCDLLNRPLYEEGRTIESNSIYDFGFINKLTPKTANMTLSNQGTDLVKIIDVIVTDAHLHFYLKTSKMKNISDRVISLDEVENMHHAKTGFEISRKEFDWDEIDEFATLHGHVPIMNSTQKWVLQTLAPGQSITLGLSFGGFENSRTGEIRFIVEKGNKGGKEIYIFPFAGTTNPPIRLIESNVDFGIKAMCSKNTTSISFSNTLGKPVKWALTHFATRTHVSPEHFVKSHISSYSMSDIKNMIQLFPNEGILPANCTQMLDIIFKPEIPFCEISGLWNLKVEGCKNTRFTVGVLGKGALSKLACNCQGLDFGAIRVGVDKTLILSINNEGSLLLNYFAECKDPQILITPEQGVLNGNGSTQLTVKYTPYTEGVFESTIRIHSTSEEPYPHNPIVIPIRGFASYPDVTLITKQIDFGMALLGFTNIQMITIENRGLVEANIQFQSSNPEVRVEKEIISILPKQQIELPVIYTPKVIEKLSSKAILRCVDPRGDMSILQLKGKVGVPSLVVYPLNGLEDFDFGVCKIKEVEVKTFSLVNEGNIDLEYQIIIQRDPSVDKNTFTISPIRGHLKVNEKAVITIEFRPRKMLESVIRVTLDYKFNTIKGLIRGCGGKAIVQVDLPNPVIDYGVCRIGRVFYKEVQLTNHGNFSCQYRVRPEPTDGDWSRFSSKAPLEEQIGFNWQDEIKSLNLDLIGSDGFCKPYDRTVVRILFKPTSDLRMSCKFRIFYDEDLFYDFEVCGVGNSPKLQLFNGDKPIVSGKTVASIPFIDIGTHPVGSEQLKVFTLRNMGPFGVDFLLQPLGVFEFEVAPRRGFVDAGKSVPIKIFFRPKSEEFNQVLLKILWEGEPISLILTGAGGIGRLQVEYSEEKDMQAKCLDFGVVPTTAIAEKRFHLYNNGRVELSFNVSIDVANFLLGKIGEPFSIKRIPDATSIRVGTRRNTWQWFKETRMVLAPKHGIEMAVKFDAKQVDVASTMNGTILFQSSASSLGLPLRGRSGTFGLSHRGDLNFGDIAASYMYQRKITLVNSGSIATTISLEWNIAGNVSGEGQGTSHVKLAEVYGNYDPRSGWFRQQYTKEKKLPVDAKFSALDYWRLLQKVVVKARDSEPSSNQSLKNISGINSSLRNFSGSSTRIGNSKATALGASVGTSIIGLGRKAVPQQAMHTKRRHAFLMLIQTTVVSSQSSSKTRPYLDVNPTPLYLPAYGTADVNVEIALTTEETFLATLLCRPNVPSCLPYEIGLTATPKLVNIVLDDTSPLDFGRQPIGGSETLTRTFKNIGKKAIQWKISNQISELQVIPSKGTLGPGASTRVDFIFSPKDESTQSATLYFEPDCSAPVRLLFYGGGGTAKISLTKFKRFDFGFCMIGKNTESGLPITNEGNANLHLTIFDLAESRAFKRGHKWPVKRVSLAPGETFILTLVFCPNEESPAPGRLVVGTNSHKWEIELIGSGREAVLIVSRISMEFIECVVGNTYEQKLGLKNVGDVNYPVEFRIEPEMTDFSFHPPSVLLKPFSEGHVVVKYAPKREFRRSLDLIVSSPYSSHLIPVTVHSGTITLDFNKNLLDFGLFEKSSKPSMSLIIKNTGTLKTNFSIKTHVRPPLFQLSSSKGAILPRKIAEIVITHVKAEVHQIMDHLIIKTDAVDKTYQVQLRGNSEEAAVKKEEFSQVNLGVCPAMQTTNQTFKVKNYGRFPLALHALATYPLKIFPTSAHVEGDAEATISVAWYPSGGYELRSVIRLETNIGAFDVMVRGKALLPEVTLRNQNVDFGICAVGHKYTSCFAITNKGKVPLYWSMASNKEVFILDKQSGEVKASCTEEVPIHFLPATIGRQAATMMLECRGLNFKEIHVSGVGGSLGLDMEPKKGVGLGPCPCYFNVASQFTLYNSGDVTLHLRFESDLSQSFKFVLPEGCDLLPRHRQVVDFSAIATEEGHLAGAIFIKSKELSLRLPITGVGVKIHLRPKIVDLLQSEQLSILKMTDALQPSIRKDVSFKVQMYRLRSPLQGELEVIEAIDSLRRLPPSAAEEVPQPLLIPEDLSEKKRLIRLRQGLQDLFKNKRQRIGVDGVDALVDQFILNKIDLSAADENEPHSVLDRVIHYPYVNIEDVDYDVLLKPIDLSEDMDLSPILARPPPMEENKHMEPEWIMHQQYLSQTYGRPSAMMDPLLGRKERNSPTATFLKGKRPHMKLPSIQHRQKPSV